MPVSESAPTVLHYLGYDEDRGGIASVVRALKRADRFGCVLGMNGGAVQQGVPPLPMLELPRLDGERIDLFNAWRALNVSRAVRKWLKADPRRVFHGHSRAGLLVGLWLNWMGDRRLIVSVHCYGRQRWFYRWAARRLRRRLVWLTPEMKRYYGIITPGWEDCIPNGLPPRPQVARQRPLRKGRLTIGGAGQVVSWKCWDLVLEAMALLPDELRSRVEFVHAGAPTATSSSAEYAKSLIEQTRRLALAGQVEWLGWQPSSEALISRVDVVVVASKREPFSMSALEALRAGVPVIAADEGGPRDFVVEGVNGWFFRSEEARDLARVLTMLLETEALSRVSIEEEALARFDVRTVAEGWRTRYDEVIVSGD
jgi:glycosyltransferase involved in cell wall biosynthesis